MMDSCTERQLSVLCCLVFAASSCSCSCSFLQEQEKALEYRLVRKEDEYRSD